MRLRSWNLFIVLAFPLTAFACGDDMGAGETTGIAVTTFDGGSDGDPKLDMSDGDTDSMEGNSADDGGGVQACVKLDVILAVDNSSSMDEEVAALRGPVFDSLPDQLLDVGNGIDDFHLAVVDACPKPAHFHDTGQVGACNFSTGGNYMISSSPALVDEFACVTGIVDNGWMGMGDMCLDDGEFNDDDEQPALTAATALSPIAELANSGFLRDDAILFVVAITDEDERMIDTNAEMIAQTLIDAKGGKPENVVFLGIGGGQFCLGEYGTASPATNLQQTTALFEVTGRGLFWDLCDGDLEGAFAAAIDIVDSACDEFDPPE